MDRAKNEVEMRDLRDELDESQLTELTDLQLAFVGGGSGDTILH